MFPGANTIGVEADGSPYHKADKLPDWSEVVIICITITIIQIAETKRDKQPIIFFK